MGMRSQIGLAAETTYGTYEAASRFLPLLRETIAREKRTIESQAIRGRGRRAMRAKGRVAVGRAAAGRIDYEVAYEGFGLLFEHILGDVESSQPDDVGAPTVWEHLFTLGSLKGKSLSIQKGVEREDETVVPFSYVGSKIVRSEFAVQVDGMLTLGVDIDARDELANEPLEVANFVEGNPAHFAQAALKLDGVPVADVRSATSIIESPMNVARYYLGNQGLKAEQRDQGHIGLSGQLEADFVDEATLYAAFADDTKLELELQFLGAEIEDGHLEEITITYNDVRLGGQTPQISGPELPTLTVPYMGFDDGVAEDVQILLRTTDATP